MATWTYATDVVNSWIGDDAPTDRSLIEVWISRAERLLRSKLPNLASRIDDAERDLEDNVKDVVSNMVQRVFRNPTGARQANVTTGPFTESTTFGGDQPGYLWVTDEELAMLSGTVAASGKAFMVDTAPPDAAAVYGGPPWAGWA